MPPRSEEHCRKISERMMGNKHGIGKRSLAFREACSQRMLGDNNPSTRYGSGFKGKIMSEESKKKLSEAKKGHAPWNTGLCAKNDIRVRLNIEHATCALIKRIFQNGGVGFGGYRNTKRGIFFSFKNQKEIKYGSGMELSAYFILENLSRVKSYDRCEFSIDYTLEGSIYRYIPDILVIYNDNTKEVIEVKPEYLLEAEKNIAKFNSAKEYCSKNNLLFSVWTENIIKREGKTNAKYSPDSRDDSSRCRG